MNDVRRFDFDVTGCQVEDPLGGYVDHDDYAKLEAEAQALREEVKNRTAECNGLHEMLRQEHDRTEKAREEVSALRARIDDALDDASAARTERDEAGMLMRVAQGERDELRARVVVLPERMTIPVESSGFVNGKLYGWNHCLDELARLNGKAVSEGLLRDIYLAGWQASGEGWNEEYPGDAHNRQEWKDSRDAAIKSLLGEGKES